MTATSAGLVASTAPSADGVSGEAIYFGRGRRLFGWLHSPSPNSSRLDCAVLICAPLGYEELCAHRALRHWAIALANGGVATLRFDYDGTGNSAGSDIDPHRVDAWIASTVDAGRELRARAGTRNLVVAGVRLGATLGMAAAARLEADGLIAFGAPAVGRSYVRELRAFGRLMRAGPGADSVAPIDAEEVGGFVITRATLDSLTALDPLSTSVGVRRALVIPRDDVAADATVPDRLTTQGTVVERATLPGYAAMMVDAHDSVPPRAVMDASLAWLSAQYGGATGVVPPRAAPTSVLSPDADGWLTDEATREHAVSLSREAPLFGVITEPCESSARVGTGVVLVNAGSVHHVGPGRMYVMLAREWARLGFTVLRMDISGVGDSAGRPGAPDNHPYPAHAVSDIRHAVTWLGAHGNCDRVVVAGLCSGAHASFHAGLELDGIAGVIAINPIVFHWTPACALDVAAWMTYTESQRYSRSARQLASWVRLLRGEVRVGYAASIAYRRAREVAEGALGAFARRIGMRREGAEDVAADLSRISARGVTTLLVFSEGDPGLDLVRRRYSRDLRRLERDRRNFAMRIITNADHTFTRCDARDRLRELLTSHLMDHHRG